MHNIKDILIRYFLLLILATFDFWILYFLFTPITLYAVYFLLEIFFEPLLNQNIIYLSDVSIELIPACIAGAAYYLLLMLNLSTPEINLKKRIFLISQSFFIFLIINILRIFILSLLLSYSSNLFDITHKLFWYFISTIFVVGIWFFQVKHYRIEKIPFYSDIKYLWELRKQTKESKGS